ncbi:sensor histidine kinase, partial [Fulvivirga aurantia]|uniref:sensor histidine kinase n=1 Tax=Fulvivirga aurantia TaxID=2529383 RepID=UPI001624BAE5
MTLLVKTKISIGVLGNTYVFIGGFAVVVLTYYSGGVWSAIYPWIISIPVLAILVVNRRSGVIWTVISFGFMVWFAILAVQGVELPVEYNLELRTIWYVTIVPGLLLIVMFMAFVFESNQTNALLDLERKNKQLEAQKETIGRQSTDLEQLIEDKDYIIRILAHDLRGPLRNINGMVTLMKMETDASRIDEYIQMISQAAANAENLVNRVLEMDESDQKNPKVQLEEVEVSKLLGEVLENMDKAARNKSIGIEMINNGSSDRVEADKTYLMLIFENLISNAIKFTEKGKEVLVRVTNDTAERLHIRFIDQGPGISPEERGKLFKKF